MKMVAVPTYKFEELSDAAKEKARSWWREGSLEDSAWTEFTIADFIEILKCMGVTVGERTYNYNIIGKPGTKSVTEPRVYWSGFWSQGDGASFEGTYEYVKGSHKLVREYAPVDTELHRIADALAALQKRYFYTLTANITQRDNHYVHKYTMGFEVEALRGPKLTEEDEKQFAELMRDLAGWLYATLEKEYEYQNSDEQVDETITANEYDFTVEGKRCLCL